MTAEPERRIRRAQAKETSTMGKLVAGTFVTLEGSCKHPAARRKTAAAGSSTAAGWSPMELVARRALVKRSRAFGGGPTDEVAVTPDDVLRLEERDRTTLARRGRARSDRAGEKDWPRLKSVLRDAVEQWPRKPGKENARPVALKKQSALSPAAQALLQSLPLPTTLEFSELEDFGTILLESTPLDVEAAAQLWTACRHSARASGWSCFLVAHSLGSIEPPRGEIEADLAKLANQTEASFFDVRRRQLDEDYEDDEEADEDSLSAAARRSFLQRLTAERLPNPIVRQPDFNQKGCQTSKKRNLVLARGGPEHGPVLYRFGGFNACPLPTSRASWCVSTTSGCCLQGGLAAPSTAED